MAEELILDGMKELRSVTGENRALEFAARRSVEMVKGYCNIQEISKELVGVCISIGLWLYDNDMYKTTKSPGNGPVKSIREGQVSVTFQEEKKLQGMDESKILVAFSTELNRFRKMGWKR